MRPTPTVVVSRTEVERLATGRLRELAVPAGTRQGDLIEVRAKGDRAWENAWVVVHAVPPVEGGPVAVRPMEMTARFLRPTSDGGSTTSYTDYTNQAHRAMPHEPEAVGDGDVVWIVEQANERREQRFRDLQVELRGRRVADRLADVKEAAAGERLDVRSEVRAIEKLLTGDRKKRARAMAGLEKLERRLFW